MQAVQKPITGREDPGDLSMPQQALSQFYRTFNASDMEMMAQNWTQPDDIVMDNPLGGIKRGWSEIQPAYARIFEGPAQVDVKYYDYTLRETAEMFYTTGRERDYFCNRAAIRSILWSRCVPGSSYDSPCAQGLSSAARRC